MDKEKNDWAKCMIVSYRYLERMCKAIDKQIEQVACYSFFQTSNFDQINSVHNVSKKIIALSQRKIDYINIKVLVEKVLESMDKKLSKILILKYIHNLKNSQLISLLKINERTMFRKINTAFDVFAKKMQEFGFSKEKLELVYFSDEFIGSVYKKIKSQTRVSEKTNDLINIKSVVLSNISSFDTFLTSKNTKMA